MMTSVRRLLLAAAHTGPQKSSFLETGTEEQARAASLVLDAYSTALDSPPLHQLSLSRIGLAQLRDLWKKLQAVDPMKYPNAAAPAGKQAQAERWCEYFEKNR